MKLILLFCLMTMSQVSYGAMKPFSCPGSKEKMSFNGLGLFDGDPKERVQLKPDNGDDPLPHQWSLDGDSNWAACLYGDQQKPLIKKKLSAKITQCETVESKSGSGVFNSLVCK